MKYLQEHGWRFEEELIKSQGPYKIVRSIYFYEERYIFSYRSLFGIRIPISRLRNKEVSLIYEKTLMWDNDKTIVIDCSIDDKYKYLFNIE